MENQNQDTQQQTSDRHGHDDNDHHNHHKVKVKVDKNEVSVRSGSYTVSEFKAAVGVDAAKELDQIINGILIPLDDTATIIIKGGEQFISHVRAGGSS